MLMQSSAHPVTTRIRILQLSPGGRSVSLWLVPVDLPEIADPEVVELSLSFRQFKALGVCLGDLVRLGRTPAGAPVILGPAGEAEVRHA